MRRLKRTIPISRPIKACLMLLGLSFLSLTTYADTNITGAASTSLGKQLYFLEDAASELTIGDMLLDRRSDSPFLNWQKSQDEVPNFGYTDSSYWFRATLATQQPVSDYLLAVEYPLLDELDVFVLNDGKITGRYITGDTRQFDSRPIPHRDFLFPISLQTDEITEIYIRVKTQGAHQLPVSLWQHSQYMLADQSELALKNLYYGMMIVMILYNLFLFFSIRERAYLFYVGFVFCFLAMQATMHGLLFQLFFRDVPELHQLSVLFFVPCTMLFSCLFTISFLNLKQVAPKLDLINRWVAVAAFACVLGAFILPYSLSTRISVLLVIVASVLMMISGPVAWKNGQTSARYYTVAWFLLLIGTTSMAMSKFGVLPSNLFTEYGLILGSAAEAILLSFALADRLNSEKEARYQAQQSQLQEIEQREAVEEKLLYLSTHEASTGLPNKILLSERVQHIIEQSDVDHFALVQVSLGRFSEIVNTLGQTCADQILKLFSQRLGMKVETMNDALNVDDHHMLAQFDTLAFSFILNVSTERNLNTRLEQLRQEISTPVEYRDMRIETGVTIGAAVYPEHSGNHANLLKHAQIAVGFSGNSVNVYQHALNPYNERRLRLMGELQNAIEQNELRLHFQPQVDIDSGRVIGVEALVRWNHPVYGNIPPMEFIPQAEQTGLIKPLTFWVLDHALYAAQQLALENQTDASPLEMSINISAVNLHEANLVKNIQLLLTKHQVNAGRLKIEITETAMMLDPENALKVLTRLHDIGVKIAVDDYGTGQSSLNYIKKLPADEIKIDRSFITDMNSNADDEVIVSTTISMCHNLGYSVVAEGIEDPQTLQKLKLLHCDVAQGYYHCMPLAFDEFRDWLKGNQQQAS